MIHELCAPFDPDVMVMFREKLGISILPNTATFLAFRTKERVLGGWMFERYTGRGGSVCAHWASNDVKRWVDRDKLSICALYVFGQLGCKTVFGEVASSDTYVRRVNEKLGFVKCAELPGYFPDDDLVLYRLDKTACRWLPQEFKQENVDG